MLEVYGRLVYRPRCTFW